MAKRSKLLTALDIHKGRDYKLEKQKKQQKQAAKKLRSKAQDQHPRGKGKEDVERKPNGTRASSNSESGGSESEAAEPTAVC